MKYKVYGLADPRNGNIRYVGVTASPNTRVVNHISEAMTGTQTRKSEWIRDLIKNGMEPDIQILAEIENKLEACNAEREEIRKRFSSGMLTNVIVPPGLRSLIIIPCQHCEGKCTEPLPEYLEETLLAIPAANTTEQLANKFPLISRTAQNNRLEKLRLLGLVKRERNGKEWIYSTI